MLFRRIRPESPLSDRPPLKVLFSARVCFPGSEISVFFCMAHRTQSFPPFPIVEVPRSHGHEPLVFPSRQKSLFPFLRGSFFLPFPAPPPFLRNSEWGFFPPLLWARSPPLSVSFFQKNYPLYRSKKETSFTRRGVGTHAISSEGNLQGLVSSPFFFVPCISLSPPLGGRLSLSPLSPLLESLPLPPFSAAGRKTALFLSFLLDRTGSLSSSTALSFFF